MEGRPNWQLGLRWRGAGVTFGDRRVSRRVRQRAVCNQCSCPNWYSPRTTCLPITPASQSIIPFQAESPLDCSRPSSCTHAVGDLHPTPSFGTFAHGFLKYELVTDCPATMLKMVSPAPKYELARDRNEESGICSVSGLPVSSVSSRIACARQGGKGTGGIQVTRHSRPLVCEVPCASTP